MIALSLLIILVNLFNISHAFGCTSCGKQTKPTTRHRTFYTRRVIKIQPTAAVQDIVNRYCKADENICHLEDKGINHLEYVKFPPEITILHLSNNNIVSLENSRFPANLVELYLASNKLCFDASILSVNLTYLTSLRMLNLNYNKIHGLENVYLPHNLTILSLKGNTINSFLNITDLRSLSSLQMLNLNKNWIKSITTNIRDKLPSSLTSLLLNQNKLTIINTEIPESLNMLDLRNNPLKEYHIRNLNDVCRILTQNTPLASTSIVHHISRLPTLVWNEKMMHVKNCQICCEDFNNGDNVRILPCLHKFHCDCVYPWLFDKPTCPECRHNITVVE